MHKVIFDTDPGVDDAMALLFLHNHPEIDLIGITTVFGNASIETTTRNALFLKREWGIGAPVAKGDGKTYNPMRNPIDWPVMIHGHDGLGNIDVPETIDLPLDPRPAHRFIIETVRANPGEVTLIAVGRMSNLAYALKEDPEIAGLVKQVIIMGGAFDVPGNITARRRSQYPWRPGGGRRGDGGGLEGRRRRPRRDDEDRDGCASGWPTSRRRTANT
ncbi:hypothetical protein HA402_007460 [Bradysia odoriphaga]|nr:hypothetical protein HA402_007460 [Bradysia odoriphaga]